MKRGTYAILPVQIGIDLDTVQEVKFLFEQCGTRLVFDYPSDQCAREPGENIINIFWTKEQTYMFDHGPVKLDTHIKLIDAATNPETEIATFDMHPTLFTLREIDDD